MKGKLRASLPFPLYKQKNFSTLRGNYWACMICSIGNVVMILNQRRISRKKLIKATTKFRSIHEIMMQGTSLNDARYAFSQFGFNSTVLRSNSKNLIAKAIKKNTSIRSKVIALPQSHAVVIYEVIGEFVSFIEPDSEDDFLCWRMNEFMNYLKNKNGQYEIMIVQK